MLSKKSYTFSIGVILTYLVYPIWMFDFLITCRIHGNLKLFSVGYRYWGCISFKRYQYSPLKNVLTKPFIHNFQSNMQEKSNFFSNDFSNDSSSESQNMHLKYLACWGIYDIDLFNNSFSFFHNQHEQFKKFYAIQQYCGEWVITSHVILPEASRPVVLNHLCTATHCRNPLNSDDLPPPNDWKT